MSQKRGPQRFVDEAVSKLLSDKENLARENNEIANVLKDAIGEPEKKLPEWTNKSPDSLPHPLVTTLVC